MSSAEAQIVYNSNNSSPMETYHETGFAKQFDLSQPDRAMDAYQKIMHQHTKQQFEMATASSRRRSTQGSIGSNMTSLSTETSNSSVDSTAS